MKHHHKFICTGGNISAVSSVQEDFFGIIDQNTSVSESNRLHVVILRFFLSEIEVYSIDFSKMIDTFPEVLFLNRFFLKLNRFICS